MNLFETLVHLFHPQRSNNHRPKVLHPQSIAFFTVIAVGFFISFRSLIFFSQSFSNILGYASSITASQVVEFTNKNREKQNLPPLSVSPALNQAALAKAEHMFSNQYWAHNAPDGTNPWFFFQQVGYHYSVAGENLARDFADTNNMVDAWMNSPTHKANIVNPQYTQIGVAVVDGELLGYETTLVVQLFGTPTDGVAEIGESATTERLLGAENNLLAQNQARLASSTNSDLLTLVDRVTFSDFASRPLLAPLQLTKAVFLAIILIMLFTLSYDIVVVSQGNIVRIVGHNLAHVSLFLAIAYLLIFFKGGVIL